MRALDWRVHSDLRVEVVISSHHIKTRKTRIFLKANMFRLRGAVVDYYTRWVHNEPTKTREELIATKQ